MSEVPNNLRSRSMLRVVDLISEGEIVGLVNGEQSIFFEETPLKNSDGTYNFTGVVWDARVGTSTQEHLKGFDSVEQEFNLSRKISAGFSNGGLGPFTFTINDANVDAIRLKMRVAALLQTTDKGDIKATTVQFTIEVQPNGGSYATAVNDTINGKTNTPYERQYRVDLPGTGPWNIRISRTTPDSDTANLQNDIYLVGYTYLTDVKLRYMDSAVVGMTLPAETFGGSIPRRSFLIKGIKIKVPTNYDPAARTYATTGAGTTNGAWDGTFKTEWTDNPAWVYYDLLTNSRYGLGQYITNSYVDKFALYEISKYCDASVSDGYGGTEPRFRINLVINTTKEAYEVLQLITSVFRGMAYWGAGVVTAVQDSPKDPVQIVTPANVIDGEFVYQSSGLKERHSVAMVQWNDPVDYYRQATEVVENVEAIQRYGYRPIEIVAYGCTSRGQAHRIGRWLLDTEFSERETVSYTASFDHIGVRPGDIIEIADPKIAGSRQGGRVASGTTTSITLDAPLRIYSGDTLTIVKANGDLMEQALVPTGAAVTSVTVTAPLPEAPRANAMYAIGGGLIANRTFRVIAVRETDKHLFEVLATSYDPNKFVRVEQNLEFDAISYSNFTRGKVAAPTGLTFDEGEYRINNQTRSRLVVNWTSSTDKQVAYYAYRTVDPSGNTSTWLQSYTNSVEVPDAEVGLWGFEVRAVTIDDRQSLSLAGTYTVLGKATPPGVATSVTATDGYGYVTVAWTNPTDTDLDYIEVWGMTTTVPANAVIGSATLINRVKATTFTHFNLTAGDRWYFWVRAVDQVGNLGAYSSRVDALVNNPVTITGYLSNESHTVTTAFDGSGGTYTSAGGTFAVYDGTSSMTGNVAVTYSVQSASSGLTISIASTGVYTVTDLTVDNGTATLRAVYKGVTIDKVYSIAKSKGGILGLNAKTITLTADKQIFTFNGTGTLTPTGQFVTLSIAKQNTTNAVTWSTSPAVSLRQTSTAGSTVVTTGDTVYLHAADFAANTSVAITATVTDGSTLTDKSTIVRVQDGAAGANALSGYLTNESHVVPANNAGTVSAYTGATGTFRIFNGTTEVTTGNSIVYSVLANSASLTNGGTASLINSSTGVFTVDGGLDAGEDSATVTFRATLPVGLGSGTIDKTFTLGKAKIGESTIAYVVEPSVASVSKSSAGAYSPASVTFSSFSTTGAAARVAYAGRFIVATSTDGSTFTTAYTSSANESSYAYTLPANIVAVRATLYLAGGTTTQLAQTTTTIVTDGVAATAYSVEPSVSSIRKTTAGAYQPTTVTFSGYSQVGTAARAAYAGRFIVATSTDAVSFTDAYTSAANESAYTYTLPANIVAVRVRMYLAGGTTTLLTQQSLAVIVDGTSGVNAVTGMLTNEAALVTAFADGSGYALGAVGGTFRVYSGATDVTTSSTFSVSGTAVKNGLTVAIGASTGVYTLSGAAWTSDAETFTLQAVYSGTTITKEYKIAKLKAGYEIVATLPATNLFTGRVVFLTSDSKLYRYTGSAWTASVPVADLSGNVSTFNLASNSSFEVTNTAGAASGPAGWAQYNNTSGLEPGTMSSTTGRLYGNAYRLTWAVNNTSSKGVYTNSSLSNNGVAGGVTGGWKASTKYVVSFYARASGTNVTKTMQLNWNINPATTTDLLNPALSANYQRYAFKLVMGATPPSNGELFIGILNGSLSQGTLDIDDVMVVEGDVLTDYSPKPNEIYPASVRVDSFASGIEPVTVVTSVPSTKSTNSVFNTTDAKLYRWNGTAYVATVATSDLSGTVQSAQIADAALTTAKFAAGIEPITTVTFTVGSPPATKTTSTIFNTTDSKLYRWNGSAYTLSIPTTDLSGTIATAQIANNAVTATQIADATLTAAKFVSNVEPVTVVTSVPGTKSTSTIFNSSDGKMYRWNGTSYVATVATTDLSGTLTDAQLSAIAATKITGQITGTQITDGAVSAVKIAANTITASQIAANTITASQIAASTITASQIASNTITASQIAASTITASQIAADTITGTQIAANAISASEIAANAVTTSKLLVSGDGAAITDDPNTVDLTAWTSGGTIAIVADTTSPSGSALQITTTGHTTYSARNTPIDPLKNYLARIKHKQVSGTSTNYLVVAFFDSAGAVLTGTANPTGWPSAGSYHYFGLVAQTGTAGWTEYSIAFGPDETAKIPTGTVYVRIGLLGNYIGTGEVRITHARITEKASGELIVDGAITAGKVAAGAIVAGKIAANAVTTNELAANAVTAAKIAANTITAAQIAANTITASQIAANTITSAQIAADTITAGQIAAGAISASELAAGAVTASKLLIANPGASLLPDPTFEDQSSWFNTYGGTLALFKTVTDAPAGRYVAYCPAGVNARSLQWYPGSGTSAIPIDRNKQYRLSFWYRAPSTASGNNFYATVQQRDSTGAVVGANGGHEWYTNVISSVPSTWTKIEAIVGAGSSYTFAATTRFICPSFLFNWEVAGGEVQVNDIRLAEVVTGTLIQDGVITTAKMTANSISGDRIAAGTLDASKITADSITAGQIAAGAISASELAVGAVTAEKLVVTSFGDSSLLNPAFEQASTADATLPAHWSRATVWGGTSATSFRNTTTFLSGTAALTLNPGAGVAADMKADSIPVVAGDTWYLSYRALSSGTNAGTSPGFYARLRGGTTAADLSVELYAGVENVAVPTAWTRYEQTFVIPSGTTWVAPIFLNYSSNTGAAVHVDDVVFKKVVTSAVIADGAITTAKITANAVTTGKLAASAVTATEIAAGAITTAKLAAGAVTANEIATNTITANNIAAGTITSAQMSVTSLSSLSANIGTVTAGVIQNSTGSAQFDLTNAKIVFNNGSYMKVTGIGFGASSNYLEWYGPTVSSASNFAACTDTNAIYYLKTNGTAYFGGVTPSPRAAKIYNTQVTTVTEVAPLGVSKATIEIWGASGAGGCSNFSGWTGGTGGTGAYARSTISISPGQTVIVTTGPAGAAATGGGAGGAGGTTTVTAGTATLTTMTAPGGGGGGAGTGNSTAAGGAAGTTATGGNEANSSGTVGSNAVNTSVLLGPAGVNGYSQIGATGGTSIAFASGAGPGGVGIVVIRYF